MTKKIIIVYILILLVVISAVYIIWIMKESNDIIEIRGEIKYINLEGGFYGVVDHNGNKYFPINLPKQYQVDGLKVFIKARLRKDIVTTAMWGIPIQIIEIHVIK